MVEGVISHLMKEIEEGCPTIADRFALEHLTRKEERGHPVPTVIPIPFTSLPWEIIIDTAAITVVHLFWLYQLSVEDMKLFREIQKKNPEVESVLKSKAKIVIAKNLAIHLLNVFSPNISFTLAPEETLRIATETIEKNKEYADVGFYMQNLIALTDTLEQSLMEFTAIRKTLIVLVHFPELPKTTP